MKKNHLILGLFLSAFLVISWINNIRAQQFDWIAEDFPGSWCLGVTEIDSHYYGVVSNGPLYNHDPNTNYHLSLFELEIDQPGNPGLTVNEFATIPYSDYYATIDAEYIEETDVWIIVQSAVIGEGRQRYRVILYDVNFNIITEQSIDTTGYPFAFFIESFNGKTYVLGTIVDSHKLLFLQYSHSNPYYLPPIVVKRSEPESIALMTSMRINQRNGDMLIFYHGGIAELDTNLHMNFRLGYDEIQMGYHGAAIGTKTNYFSHGLADREISGGIYQSLVFQKYDTLFNILAADTVGKTPQANYPFLIKSLDYNNHEFIVGGHLGPFNGAHFHESIKKFSLTKFDEELNRLWYKEYGGDRATTFLGLKLIDNGGCFAYGAVIDLSDSVRYAYIMYVDANGEILTSQTIPHQQQTIQVINPGDETLRIFNPEGHDALIELYDIQGCPVLKVELNVGLSEIDAGELPIGIYPYLLIRDGRVIGNGKWVKGE